ncbi:MAG: HAD hydrolase-like protein [Pseudodesulfovibrio sp.]
MALGIKTVIFDFDGTLVESVGIKDDAFAALFVEYPGRLDEIMDYHRANNHTIRYEKFEHIHRNILGLEYTDEDRDRLSRRFSALVFERIVACPWVAGAGDLLALGAEHPFYLVSMSPREELLSILEHRGILGCFKAVYASEWTKTDAIRDILAAEGIDPLAAVYVGDTPEDQAAAEAAGVQFIGRDSGRPLKGRAFKDMHEAGAALGLLQGGVS